MHVKYHVDASCKASIGLNESEIRALHALTVYGVDSFLKTFYAHLGRSALEPNEPGLMSAFEKFSEFKQVIRDTEQARTLLKGQHEK